MEEFGGLLQFEINGLKNSEADIPSAHFDNLLIK
jgi:hypothetical protein